MRARMLALGLFVAMLSTAPLAAKETGFLLRSVKYDIAVFRYSVYVPADWNPNKKWPVILSLHGAGERGHDGLLSTENGIGRAIRRDSVAFPFLVVFPHCPPGETWNVPAVQEVAIRALEATIREFHGDRARLYLTGLSMGGYGTWDFAMHYAGRFAALVPVCGGLRAPSGYSFIHSRQVDLSAKDPYAAAAKKLAGVPVWIFHGAKDPVVPVDESRRMAEALRAVGNTVRYSEYPEATHNSWDRAYAEPELVKWLLEQRRK